MFLNILQIDQFSSVRRMSCLEPSVPINKVKSENVLRSKIKVKEFNDWESLSDEQAGKSGKIEVDYPKVDADTVEDKLLNLKRTVEHMRKARLLSAGMKTKLDRIEQFHAGEAEQAFRAWKSGFVENQDNMKMSIKEALQCRLCQRECKTRTINLHATPPG